MRFKKETAPNPKAWRRNEKRVEVSILELDSSSKLNSEWQAYWWTKSRAVKRRWLYERARGRQVAQPEPVAKGKVLAVEDIKEINVGLDLNPLANRECFCNARINIEK